MSLLYANENFPLAAIVELRRIGHDVLTVHETGRANQAWPDSQVLAFATGERRAVLTLNRRHFILLHQKQPTHAGIIVCTFDRDFVNLAQRIDAVISQNMPLAEKLLRVYLGN